MTPPPNRLTPEREAEIRELYHVMGAIADLCDELDATRRERDEARTIAEQQPIELPAEPVPVGDPDEALRDLYRDTTAGRPVPAAVDYCARPIAEGRPCFERDGDKAVNVANDCLGCLRCCDERCDPE